MHEVRIPQLGVNDVKALLVDWSVKNNALVKAGQEIFVIETSKVTQSVAAERDGFLKQKAAIGEELDVNSLVGWISDSADEKPASPAAAPTAAGGVEMTQKAKELAQKMGVRIDQLPRNKGILREKDILDFLGQSGDSEGPAPASGDLPLTVAPSLVKEVTPLTRAQKQIKDAMLKSLATNAGSYVSIEIKAAELQKKLSAMTAAAGVAVRVNEAVLFAVSRALAEHSEFNGFFWNDQFVRYNAVNVGVAVDVDGLLLVPVIRDAAAKSLEQLARESALLQMKVLRKTLSAADCEHGTFTVTNLFGLGVQVFVPIINGPQAAILAVGGDAEKIILGVTYDHRINNGMATARFLKSIAGQMENLSVQGEKARG